MAGIYIHIPFCNKACHYCNFHFSTSLKSKTAMIDCISQELVQRSKEIPQKVNTIYFGGGTPSLLDKEELDRILVTIKNNYELTDELEITIEANPDDLDENNLIDLLSCGFNRLSIGVQSFNDNILYQMNRSHSSEQSFDAINTAQRIGFDNISIDLMFGLPDLDLDLWVNTLKAAISLNLQHISCYNLTIEESTALWHFVNKKRVTLPPIIDQEEQFFIADKLLSKHGFNHYEISNYSKGNFESRHNTNYWNRSWYLGVGPSAHSFVNKTRRWNISNNSKYIAAIKSKAPYSSQEILSSKDQFNEFIMLSLRTTKGINKAELANYVYSEDVEFKTTLNTLISDQIILDSESHLKLTKESCYLCDHYSSQFFIS